VVFVRNGILLKNSRKLKRKNEKLNEKKSLEKYTKY
jgi:hypothetical protein